MKFFLRNAVASDVDAIAEAEEICFGVNGWSPGAVREFIENEYSHVIVAEADGIIIGYAGAFIICGESEITNVAVLPEKRRYGVGGAMLEKLFEISLSLGAEKMTLEVREGNLPAIKLYEKLGFYSVGKRCGYYTDPKEDAVIMMKSTKSFDSSEKAE